MTNPSGWIRGGEKGSFFVKWPPPFNIRVQKRKITLWSNWAWPWSRQSYLSLLSEVGEGISDTIFYVPIPLVPLRLGKGANENGPMSHSQNFFLITGQKQEHFLSFHCFKFYLNMDGRRALNCFKWYKSFISKYFETFMNSLLTSSNMEIQN